MPLRAATVPFSPVRMSAAPEMLLALALLALQATLCHGACVELDSDTEAVANEGFKLGCISCKMRGEVPAIASVNWYFKALDDTDFSHLYSYESGIAEITDSRFYERLHWNGSKNTKDLQDGSIYILNVTFNDTGTYQCIFNRLLSYNNYEFQTNATKTIVMNVVPRRKSKGQESCMKCRMETKQRRNQKC